MPPKMTMAKIDSENEKPNSPGVDSWKPAPRTAPPAKPGQSPT